MDNTINFTSCNQELYEAKETVEKEMKKYIQLTKKNKKLENQINDLSRDISYLTDVVIELTNIFENNNKKNRVNIKETNYGFKYLLSGFINGLMYLSFIIGFLYILIDDYPITIDEKLYHIEFNPVLLELKDKVIQKIVTLIELIFY